ncbi:DNA mismatch repair protein Msh6-like [Glandiceps talaboti]
MPKTNTLFSYFTKSPAAAERKIPSPTVGDVPSEKSKSNSPGEKANQRSPRSKQNGAAACQFKIGDIVWAKLDRFPWWPSLVCQHPTRRTHYKGGKTPMVHVQFFDDSNSRAWIKEKFVQPFTGLGSKEVLRGGKFFSPKPDVQKATKDADNALKLSVDERLELVVCTPSDDEDANGADDGENEEEEMEVENENSEDDSDSEDEVANKKPQTKRPRAAARKAVKVQKQSKRRRIIVESDSDDDEESGDEFKPGSDFDSDSGSSGVDENDLTYSSVSEPETPQKPLKRKRGATTTPRSAPRVKKTLSEFTTPKLNVGNKRFNEDKKKRLHTDPDYDPRTIHVPDIFLGSCTPAMRQWWDMKSNNFDAVLFFKMGKFYELYHMDAEVGVKELGLIMMKGTLAHSGFPEIAFGRYANTLIQKGYRVARVEQTETPDMMNERCKKMIKPTKFDKVVKRELCRISTKGTKTYSFIDGDTCEAASNYLLAVTEKPCGDVTGGESIYGVCFVDASIGKFHLGQFHDDRHCSRFRTLLAHFTPAQVLYEKGKLLQKTQQVFKDNLLTVLKDCLSSGSEFWDSSKTLKFLAEEKYFEMEEEEFWPEGIKKMLSETDTLGLTAKEDCELAISALGAITWYLKKCFLEDELLSMRNFTVYKPIDNLRSTTQTTTTDFTKGRHHMVLDGVTLNNLDVMDSGVTGNVEGTLLAKLDNCSTPFGKRLFKQWLCAPLCNPKSINDRLDAIEDLMKIHEVVTEVTDLLRKLPDLERLLSKIHSLGLARKDSQPDTRAIFFEDVAYSKRKIEDFLATLQGFKNSLKIVKLFETQNKNFKSKLLKRTTLVATDDNPKGSFPNIKEELAFFDSAFDHAKAKSVGAIIPRPGVDSDYDDAVEDVRTLKQRLDHYLDRQKQRLGNRSLTYWGTGKNRYQLEVPECAVRNVPDEYELTSSKKGWKRYTTDDIQELLQQLIDAEDKRDVALKDIMRRIFAKFDEHYKDWDTAVQCLAVLDVLLSLTHYSQSGDGEMCRPEVMAPSGDTKPCISICNARHPCVTRTFSGGDFIPNDTYIGCKDETDEDGSDDTSSCVLVTGPNMGGKSTLMRQVGLIVIVAQMGCYVPAESCKLTPVDRVFTRLGASDRIMSGESTFYVELSETSAILQHATKHSLVLVDELGRGTATYDGTAIACAVVKEISEEVQCRTLFSTHYHSLVEEFSHDANIRLGHMACMVENENEEDPSQETITFLYKFVKGACPKSYGFNAARLADLPEEVISKGQAKARDFEAAMDRLKLFKTLSKLDVKTVNIEHLKTLKEQIHV